MFIKVKTNEGESCMVNLDNSIIITATQTGISFQVVIKMVDGSRLTAIMTLDSVQKLRKLIKAQEFI